jgi:hypothetical protein
MQLTSACQDHRAHAGQSQHSRKGLTLRGFPGCRSATDGWAFRTALHAQPRQLAGSRRIRTRHSVHPMPRPPHSRQSTKLPPGNKSATPITPRQIGTSLPRMLALNSSIYPRTFLRRGRWPAALSDAARRAFRRDCGLALGTAFAAETDKRVTLIF